MADNGDGERDSGATGLVVAAAAVVVLATGGDTLPDWVLTLMLVFAVGGGAAFLWGLAVASWPSVRLDRDDLDPPSRRDRPGGSP